MLINFYCKRSLGSTLLLYMPKYSITQKVKFPCHYFLKLGSDSVVGIGTRYGLDGPGIESRCGRDFQHLSTPAMGPTQPPVQCVPGHSRG
jgi:hypothetical protein